MSIVITKRGDAGLTDILFGHQLPKTHILFDVLGDLDEVKVALGFVRLQPDTKETVARVASNLQKRIVELSGRLCVHMRDEERYLDSKLSKFELSDAAIVIEGCAESFEEKLNWEKTWSTPGEDMPSTYLEQARVVARRAERNFLRLIKEQDELLYSSEFCQVARLWLNRLSDLLWLMAQHQTRK
jgi:cob(I)alamin adenosyltransferase